MNDLLHVECIRGACFTNKYTLDFHFEKPHANKYSFQRTRNISANMNRTIECRMSVGDTEILTQTLPLIIQNNQIVIAGDWLKRVSCSLQSI